MTIKRREITVYEEIDDGNQTEFPTPNKNSKNSDSDTEDTTAIPNPNDKLDVESNNKDSCIVGRTFPDLIIETINDIKVITVILLFIPFPFFIQKIDSFVDMKYPLIIGLGLNIVWHFISFLKWVFNK